MTNGLSSDLTDYPPCPECQQNNDGYWTCKAHSDTYVYECVRCDHRWARRTVEDAREYLDGKTLGVTSNGRRYEIQAGKEMAVLDHEHDRQTVSWSGVREMVVGGRLYAPEDAREVRGALDVLASVDGGGSDE